jgi:hypothetical protein
MVEAVDTRASVVSIWARDHVAVLTDGGQDPGLATLINSLVRNGFCGSLWVGRRKGSTFLDDLPGSVGERLTLHIVELETSRPLTYYKPDFIEMVWQMAEPETASVTYMDCDLVLGCDWAFVHAWVATGLAIVGDLPGRLVGAQHPLRHAWRSLMASLGMPVVRDVDQYFNAGFVGVPRRCRSILPRWSALALALEGLGGVRDGAANPHFVVGTRTGDQGLDVSSDVRALMRPYFLEDQDAFNMAIMASAIPISPMGPDAMGFTATRTPIVPHAIGPDKPWSKRYMRKLIIDGEGPSFADDVWWAYSDHPIAVAQGRRYGIKRWSWRTAKIMARLL